MYAVPIDVDLVLRCFTVHAYTFPVRCARCIRMNAYIVTRILHSCMVIYPSLKVSGGHGCHSMSHCKPCVGDTAGAICVSGMLALQ